MRCDGAGEEVLAVSLQHRLLPHRLRPRVLVREGARVGHLGLGLAGDVSAEAAALEARGGRGAVYELRDAASGVLRRGRACAA